MLVPPWVERFLSTRFYSNCTKHPDAAHKECNMYCIDCSHCRISLHSGNAVIQVRSFININENFDLNITLVNEER
ncbi:hypothetical protein PVL29_026039 [Vitis rotundifolia]|uniref:Uncharacterized protein n=1 Tax=Vitis rotundifolia TaxID=103349 RepID=A0AA39D696_VITRO|nr:hypothetical protein PVL29_026039 [Vitis rotundifolia]